jgi:hypothetical protein
VVLAAGALLVALPSVALGARVSSAGDLSARLTELARPAVRSLPQARQARRLGVPRSGPGSLLRDGGRVLVEVSISGRASGRLGALRERGARITDVSNRYATVTATVRPAVLRRLAAAPGVSAVREVLAPLSFGCRQGDVVSEGDAQLGADKAREKFGVDGGGITVGILSDSFNQAENAADGSGEVATKEEDDIKTADLPGPGNPCGDTAEVKKLSQFVPAFPGEEAADEGRAMGQIVHDLAPGARLEFASAFNGLTAFAESIGDLAKKSEVIVDDVVYLEEPFFQDGPVAVAAGEAVADGRVYLSAAGNDNLIDAEGHHIASWEAREYRDSGGCPQEVGALPQFNSTHCLDFNPGSQVDRTFGIRVDPGAVLSLDLQWDEPWNGVGTDLDAFLLNAGGNLIATSSEDNIGVSQEPIEVVQWENTSGVARVVQLVVNRFTGGLPRLKFVLVENGSGVSATEYPRSTGNDIVGPTIFGHSGAASVLAVGATPFDAPEPALEPEEYSSRGPVRHDFGPVAGTEAAEALTAPEVISKPDVEATDCGRTTFFAVEEEEDIWRFCGTSAAAPHAAAVAALMLDQQPAATPAEIGAALRSSAVAGGDPCAVGAGLVAAVGAVENLLAPPEFTPPPCVFPESEEPSGENARAAGDWGLENPPPPPVNPPPPPPPPVVETPPDTSFRRKPKRVLRTRARTARAVFAFASDQANTSFQCRIDRGRFHACPRRFPRRYGLGRHVLRARAVAPAGSVDPSPVSFSFRVRRAHRRGEARPRRHAAHHAPKR